MINIDQWIDEVTKEPVEMTVLEREQLSTLLKVPVFRKISGKIGQEINGHLNRLSTISAADASEIARIQGIIAGLRRVFDVIVEDMEATEAQEEDVYHG